MKRLEHLPTLRIDPSKAVPFQYEGKILSGVRGDTVASALFANGVRIYARSLKYHRPRGLYSLNGECSNTCMSIDGIPNVRTENTLLGSGMNVRAQNVVGTAENDRLAFMDRLSPLMPAGFYYRTLHKPAAIWPLAMKQIRKAAGLGKIAPDFEMPGRFDEIHPTADICVIGGGPAGMSAALAASGHGLRVILMECRPWLGGSFEHRAANYAEGTPFYQRARELAEQVEAAPDIRVFKQTFAVGVYHNNQVTGFQVGGPEDSFDERYVEIRANCVVAAAGCTERPLLFEHNEKPGVMQIDCAHRLARTYGLMPGRKAVFAVGHDLGLEAAVDLSDLGLDISWVADVRPSGQSPRLIQELADRKIGFLPGWTASRAHGRLMVEKVTLADLKGGGEKTVACDLLVASAGLTPVIGHLSLAQAELHFDEHTGYYLPSKLPVRMHAAGRMLGLNDPLAIEASGRLSGLKAARECGAQVDPVTAQNDLNELPGPEKGSLFVSLPGDGHKTFICFDEDTTAKNIKQAVDMGFDVPELIKRFTSAGTGPGQGGIPGANLPMFVRQYEKKTEPFVPTTIRPPLAPTFIATYAGTNHDMHKRTPIHESQVADQGIFRRIGVWKRARYFSQDFSCREEILNVRQNVGVLDGSTLGKFRIHGPDALKALQRVYVSDMSKVRVGRVKYSAMCNDDGCVIDDGVVVRRAENDYYFTTSSGRAGATAEWIRYHTRFDGWDYHLVNLTDALGVINISGPNSRKVLEKITDADVSNQAFPFSAYHEFTIQGQIPVRAMRLGFVGELSYELHVPSSFMQSLWDLVVEAGQEFNIRNFGVEAQNVLRMEKGHVILGQESEQRTSLLDLGLGFLWDRQKSEAKTVGAVALHQMEKQDRRLTLVGIKMEDPSKAPLDGSIIVDDRVRGYVATARKSFTLDEAVGMALVESELSGIGTRLGIYEDECNGKLKYARVASMPFYDPEGLRMRM